MNDATPDTAGSNTPGADFMAPIADAADQAATVAKENVGLIIAGGVALGLVAATIMPRSKKKKIARKAKNMSALVSELTAALASHASDTVAAGRDKLETISNSVSDTVSDSSAAAKKQAGQIAGGAADQLNDSGKAIARTVVKLIEKVRG